MGHAARRFSTKLNRLQLLPQMAKTWTLGADESHFTENLGKSPVVHDSFIWNFAR